MTKSNLLRAEQLQPPRGMRDFFPEDMRQREWLLSVWKDTAREFGFQPYDAPVVESLELLTRKAGEEITDQIYHFVDKSGRNLALRPEMTPSLVRMVLARKGSLRFPIKWFSIPQCFRYERMTTGRKREHYQWNVDILGEVNPIAEAELLAVALAALRRMQLTEHDVVVKVGSRQLLVDILAAHNFELDKFSTASLILDKRGKVTDESIRRMLLEGGIRPSDADTIFDILAIRTFQEAANSAPPDSVGAKDLRRLFELAKEFCISEFLEFDISVVRGLTYYTGIVFEAFDRDGEFRAIFGGGRYDKLFDSMSGIHLPAVGFGFGDVVIGNVLQHYQKSPAREPRDLTVVSYTEPTLEDAAIALSTRFRSTGTRTFILYGPLRAKKAIEYADKISAAEIAIIDPREVAMGEYILRDLRTGSQRLMPLSI
jgi:histidyl-tRNA synthetase